jgi:phage repressor protein C with HTH and peptisase S24 domain
MLGERNTFLQEERLAFIVACMELKDRLKQARKHAHMTQSELAERAGIKQASISEIERGLTRTSGYLVKLATILGVSPLWLSEGVGSMSAGDESNVVPGPPIVSPARQIDIVGTAQMGPDGHWVGLDDAGGWVETWSRDTDAYALLLRGDSMAPAIRSGWVAVCEPNHRLVPGEYVMVTTTDGQSMVKELLFQNDTGVSLMSINAAYERRTIPWTEIETIHYVGAILGPSKVLGRI